MCCDAQQEPIPAWQQEEEQQQLHLLLVRPEI